MGYSRKKPKHGRLRTYFFENTPGIFRFAALPMEISDKMKFHSWKNAISQFQLQMSEVWMVGILNHCENKAFVSYFLSKVFFLILVHVLPFKVSIIKFLYKYSNDCFLFLNKEYFFILLGTYLENLARNIILWLC